VQPIHDSCVKRALIDSQELQLATRITNDHIDKGLFDSAGDFQRDAMRLEHEIQSTTREMAGGLKSWLARQLQKSPRAMSAVLSDGGFQRRRAFRAMDAPSIQGIPKLAAGLAIHSGSKHSNRSR
jgi:hypothetical protein